MSMKFFKCLLIYLNLFCLVVVLKNFELPPHSHFPFYRWYAAKSCLFFFLFTMYEIILVLMLGTLPSQILMPCLFLLLTIYSSFILIFIIYSSFILTSNSFCFSLRHEIFLNCQIVGLVKTIEARLQSQLKKIQVGLCFLHDLIPLITIYFVWWNGFYFLYFFKAKFAFIISVSLYKKGFLH